jgi:hypothetical protein
MYILDTFPIDKKNLNMHRFIEKGRIARGWFSGKYGIHVHHVMKSQPIWKTLDR